MWELYYGGWIAKNMYYMGSSGCVEVNGVIVAAASGIYKSHDYMRGRFERQPYSMGDLRSMYHTRAFDMTKLALLDRPDIFMSHDWPNGVEQYGDVEELLRKKPFFREEIASGTLGSPPLQTLLHELRPAYWFSAHLHVRFAARVVHGHAPSGPNPARTSNPEALDLDDLDDESESHGDTESTKIPPSTTEFLALSKCTPRGDYLHVCMSMADPSSSMWMRPRRPHQPRQESDRNPRSGSTGGGWLSQASWTPIFHSNDSSGPCRRHRMQIFALAWRR